jgi:hypothetical protein
MYKVWDETVLVHAPTAVYHIFFKWKHASHNSLSLQLRWKFYAH